MNYHDGLDAATIFHEHLRWAERHAARFYPTGDAAQHDNDRSPDRPLRVGYVSPDLRQHPVGFYMEPIISRHQREQVEPFCYSDARPDALSQRLGNACTGWRNIADWSDDRVAQTIRNDRIDILIDLAGHTAGHRLLVFARRPAPVQGTYLGYVNTTGLATMDYAITDKYLDPPGVHEPFRTEILYRLPRSYLCYIPPTRCDDVGPLPATKNGYVTFACMNNFSKVTPQTLDVWARILQRVPGCRIVLQSDIAAHLAQTRERFARAGVDESRVQFVGKRPLNEYFALHNTFDIALDPFPHNGGTTTCDALWMGVPVITVIGEHAVMRAGSSILSTLGLPELVANSVEDYIDLAAALAEDPVRLANLRRTMRNRMSNSPLMDLPGFVNDLEAAYRRMWQTWLNGT
jgi:predicted O-linked N-acetylglucosamine transferase (SPINDLY family)